MGDTSVGAPTITSGQLESLQGQQGLLGDMYNSYKEYEPLYMDKMGLTRDAPSEKQVAREASIDAQIKALERQNKNLVRQYIGAPGAKDKDYLSGGGYSLPVTDFFGGGDEADNDKNNLALMAVMNKQKIKQLKEKKKGLSKGTLREMTEDEYLGTLNDTEKSLFLANKERANKQLLASQGKLELPDYIKEQLGSQRDASLESLSRRYGTDYMQTAGGRKAFEDIQKNEAAIRDAYARGEETTGMGLLGQGQGMYSNLNQQALGGYSNYANRGMGLFNAYGQAYQPWQQISQGMYDADYQAKLNRAGAWSGLLGAGGSLVGMYTGGGATG